MVPQNIKSRLAYDTTIPLLDIFTKEMKSTYQRDIALHFTATFYNRIIRISNNQSIYQLINEIKKIWYIYKIEYYLSLRRKNSYYLEKKINDPRRQK